MSSPVDTSANRARLSIVDVTFALFCLLPPLVFGAQLLNADGDPARHIRMGELILRGGLFQNDTFSFTRPDEPIVLTEWGSRVILALAHSAAGLAGVVLLSGVLIGASTALVVLFLRNRGVDPLLALLTGILAAAIGQAHWIARPHLFTLTGLALLLFLLEPGARRRRWWFGALFAVWSNLHGGFVLGLILIAAVCGGALVEAWIDEPRRAFWKERASWYGAGLMIALVASCLNPQGPVLHWHVLELLGDSALTGATWEFLSPNFHTLNGKIFLACIALTIGTIALVRERIPLGWLAVVLLMIAGGLLARRNAALFGVTALPLLAMHANRCWRELTRLHGVQRAFEEGEGIALPGRWIPAALVPVLALALARGSVAGTAIVPDRFDAEVFPVAAVEKARAAGLSGRIFHQFTWGGYLVYAWPEQKIFIDGMTDYFGAGLLGDYLDIYNLEEGWADLLDEWDISLVLVSPGTRLDYQLRREGGWRVWDEDDVAVMFQRLPTAAE